MSCLSGCSSARPRPRSAHRRLAACPAPRRPFLYGGGEREGQSAGFIEAGLPKGKAPLDLPSSTGVSGGEGVAARRSRSRGSKSGGGFMVDARRSTPSRHSSWLLPSLCLWQRAGNWSFVVVRVYLVDYIFCIIDYHICQDIFARIYIMYCRLPYVSRGALSLKTPAPLYICTSIKQYNHLTFGGTPLSNMVIRAIDFFFASAHL
jgi:hypothetical protein